ncbi:hypothetical protein BDU57DRAFT_537867 [Ampelomyces quisqualis]|uniref:Protein kinase domain-containing protein n=1 Tax=Ampelomyces quisqualis TaxID=50730 RepID=A0A6A5QRI6_AMPQU|nr:hypothetical protein BDU57DRAFT_537867 [Ampelomyces quisqualis]
MPPPFVRAYNYFKYDADIYILANRPTWTARDRQNTVSTLWAGSDVIRLHYQDAPQNAGPSPGLPVNPNLIPVLPYTVADVQSAKSTQTLPAPHVPDAAENDDEEEEGAEPDDEAPAPGPDAGPVDQAPLPEVPVQLQVEEAPALTAAARGVDKLPYDFWPQMPWSPKPDIPGMTRADRGNDEMMDAWLRTKPLMTSGEETQWHGVKYLGSGGYGAAGLWVEVNDTDVITDVMVVKDAQMNASHFRDPAFWRNGLPQEIRIHQLIEERRSVETEGYLPEIFIWYVLKALASACTLLQLGRVPQRSQENETQEDVLLPGWKPIMHLDIRTANVLLNLGKRERTKKRGHKGKDEAKVEPPQKRARLEPRESSGDEEELEDWEGSDWDDLPVKPVLADFGIAFYSLNNENCPISDNPEDHIWNREATCYAPEHQLQRGPPWVPLNEKTDVWGIGSIIWSLIAHADPENGPVREDIDAKPGSEIPLSAQRKRNRKVHTRYTTLNGQIYLPAISYSDEIKNLARACLNWDQDKRPTLAELLGEARTRVCRPEAKEELMDWERFELTLPDDVDEFEIGATCDIRRRTPGV